jgi:chromosome condensin MukBEF MukE localization factor
LRGVKTGLQIALDKIEASMFLIDKEWQKNEFYKIYF